MKQRIKEHIWKNGTIRYSIEGKTLFGWKCVVKEFGRRKLFESLDEARVVMNSPDYHEIIVEYNK